MDLHLLSDVREYDGITLGELRHVILDPDGQQVTSLVVQQAGFDGRAVIVPVETLRLGDDDAAYIDLSEEQFAHLPAYAYGVNVAPPPAEVDPRNQSADLEEELIDVPNVPPIGAATGISTIAFTPILEIWRNIPADSVIIDHGTSVVAVDGELGKVDHVLVDDETKQLAGFIVKHGTVFTRDIKVTIGQVAHIESERVVLCGDLAEYEAAFEE